MSCPRAFVHEENTTCEHCKLEVDQYGNTEADFLNCCFPDCGCDGARLCMAPNGANSCSASLNIERGTIRKTTKYKPVETKPSISLEYVKHLLNKIAKGKS